MSLVGTWKNEFGSIMTIEHVNEDGTFAGRYQSHTGATGVYDMVGITDPAPDPAAGGQAVSFSVSWHSLEGKADPSWHWVSAFAGQLQTVDGRDVIPTMMLLQKVTEPGDDWESTSVCAMKFTREDQG